MQCTMGIRTKETHIHVVGIGPYYGLNTFVGKMAMRLIRTLGFLVIIIGGAQRMLAADETEFAFFFIGEEATKGWGKTQQIELRPTEEGLELNGNGWDAKIYRWIELPAGYYLVTAAGKGERLLIQLIEDFQSRKTLFNLNIASDKWRSDWRPFRLKKKMRLLVIIRASGDEPITAVIQSLKISAVPEPVATDLPSLAELATSRPAPLIVRGCTMVCQRTPEVRAKNIADIRGWHANVARVFMGGMSKKNWTEDAGAFDVAMKSVEAFLEAARPQQLKVILTLNGGGLGFAESASKGAFWANPELPVRFGSAWKRIAERLLPYADVIYGYDLYNEPLDWEQMPHPPRQWRDIAKAAIKAIREVDPATWIIYEPGPGGMHWGFANLQPLPDTRVIYSLHFYSPHEFTHQGIYNIQNTDLAEVKATLNVRYPGVVNGFRWDKDSIRESLSPVREFQQRYQVPILVGEFSAIRWAPGNDAAQYIADLIDIFEENSWGWVYHAFREWSGWSVEHDDVWAPHAGPHNRAQEETTRAKVLKKGLARNLTALPANAGEDK